MLDCYTRAFLELEIERAQHPAGMSVHDGRVHVDASVLQRLLAVIDAQQVKADQLRGVLTEAWAVIEDDRGPVEPDGPLGELEVAVRAALGECQ